jgi:hypothetical protein
MKKFQLNLVDALKHVKTRRRVVNPNRGFFESLVNHELELTDGTEPSLSYDQYKRIEKIPPPLWSE